MSVGFFSLPRSLTRHPLWLKATYQDQVLFLILLDHVRYIPEEFDDYGELIKLEAGDICISYQELARLCGRGCTKKQAENFIQKFIRYSILSQKLGRRMGRKRMVLTISHKDTYDLVKKEFGTKNGTNQGRRRDEHKERREEVKKISSSKDSDIEPTPLNGARLSFDYVNKRFENLDDALLSLWAKAYPHANISQELAEMAAWLIANPAKKNFLSFCQRWLSKANDEAERKKAFEGRFQKPTQKQDDAVSNKRYAAELMKSISHKLVEYKITGGIYDEEIRLKHPLKAPIVLHFSELNFVGTLKASVRNWGLI